MYSQKNIPTDKEVSQAVVFIDNEENFHPLTFARSKVLMNLVNQPILKYTLDMLMYSKIQEIFVYCSEHSEKIEKFINEYKLNRNAETSILVFSSPDYTSLGTVMRDLDSRGLIKGNFILINGDSVGNLKLDLLIEKHKKNTQKDPGCVMTCVFRKLSPNHRTRLTTKEDPILVLDSNQKVLFFGKNSKRIIEIPTDLLEKSVQIHYNLFDTHISICSEKVPPDFSDNFDYESRESFINGLLADIELLQHNIYADILDHGYAGRVNKISAYENISCDLLQRFIYPIVPDIEDQCSYRRNNVYLKDKVHFASKTRTMNNVSIGENTRIGSNASINNSVIGDDCTIGDNVSIINSYIFDNVKIDSGSSIEKCMIDAKVMVGKNCNLKQTLIAQDVHIESNMSIENKKLYYDSGEESDKKLVGKKGLGKEYQCDPEGTQDSDLDDDDDDDDYQSESTKFSDSSEDSYNSLGDEYSTFYNEVFDSLSRGVEELSMAENIILEINSSKHAYNVPMKEVNSNLVKALLNLALDEKKNFILKLKSNLKYGLPIMRNYIKNIDSQNDCLYAIEEFHHNHKDLFSCLNFVKIIQYLYEENVLEEDVILQWYYKPKILPDHDTKDQQTLRKSKEVQLFIKWLQEAEEESSDEE